MCDIYEGYVEKTAHGVFKNKSRIWMVLESSTLSFFKDQKHDSCIGSVETSDIRDVTAAPAHTDREFQVRTTSKTFIFVAETAGAANGWVKAIRAAMASNGIRYDESRSSSSAAEEIENVIPVSPTNIFGVRLKSTRSSRGSTSSADKPSAENPPNVVKLNEVPKGRKAEDTGPNRSNSSVSSESSRSENKLVTNKPLLTNELKDEHSSNGSPGNGEHMVKQEGYPKPKLSKEDDTETTDAIRTPHGSEYTVLHNSDVFDDTTGTTKQDVNINQKGIGESKTENSCVTQPTVTPRRSLKHSNSQTVSDHTKENIEQYNTKPFDTIDNGDATHTVMRRRADESHDNGNAHMPRDDELSTPYDDVDTSQVEMRKSSRTSRGRSFGRSLRASEDEAPSETQATTCVSDIKTKDGSTTKGNSESDYTFDDEVFRTILATEETDDSAFLPADVRTDAYAEIKRYFTTTDRDFDVQYHPVSNRDSVTLLKEFLRID